MIVSDNNNKLNTVIYSETVLKNNNIKSFAVSLSQISGCSLMLQAAP